MILPKIDRTKLLEDKLQTSERKLPHPKTLSAWTNNSNIPERVYIRISAAGGGDTSLTNGDVPLDGVAFSRLD